MNLTFACPVDAGGCGAEREEPCRPGCARAELAREEVLSKLTATPADAVHKLFTATLYRFPKAGDQGPPLVWASCPIDGQHVIDGKNRHSVHQMNAHQGPSHAYYRVSILNAEPDIVPGWLSLRIMVEIDMFTLGDGYRQFPVSVFDGAPTDINTGIIKFPPMPIWDYRSNETPSEGVVWMLGLRRSH